MTITERRSATTRGRPNRISQRPIAAIDRLILALPLLMWIAASHRLVGRHACDPPLRSSSAQSATSAGETREGLPHELGRPRNRGACATLPPAIDGSIIERQSATAEGQRRLVREASRVKTFAGRRLTAQYPQPNADTRTFAPHIRPSADGSVRCRSSTAIISPRSRKAAELRFVHF